MKISALIRRLEAIQKTEGDIEVELRTLLQRVNVFTVAVERSVPANAIREDPSGFTGGKA